MTAQDALRNALRDTLGPAARAHGYRGSAPTWRKSTERGDVAFVNVQTSSSSNSAHLRCIVNIAVAPEPALRWVAFRAQTPPRRIHYSEGLYTDRLQPTGAEGPHEVWWDVYDTQTAQAAVADMLAQLDTHVWNRLDTLLRRDAILSAAMAGDLGFLKRQNGNESYFAYAQALLLIDAGQSDALDAALDALRRTATPDNRATTERFDAWARAQAGAAGNNIRQSGAGSEQP